MPELPDLEVLVEALTARVVGREILAARPLRPGILKTIDPPFEALIGHSVRKVSRRAKLLTLTFEPDLHAVVHLMTAGRFVLCRSGTKSTKATGFLLTFSDGEDLRLIENGSIKLASVHLVRDPGQVKGIAQAGVEPLSGAFTVAGLANLCCVRRQAKTLLTDPRAIAGIGTAYADEILYAARLSPIRYTSTLSPEEVARLYEAIQGVLSGAIDEIRARAGTNLIEDPLRDFMKVYRKEGEPCPVCRTPIAEIRYAQTRTYYCPTCQTKGEGVRDRRAWLTR